MRHKAKTHFLQRCDVKTLLQPSAGGLSTIAGTKVVGTLGPASRDVDTLVALLEAGMSCARVDLTWGTLEYHRQTLANLGEAVRRTRHLCALVLDTRGRELTVAREFALDPQGWPVHGQDVAIKAGQRLTLTTRKDAQFSAEVFPIHYEHFADALCRPGDSLFIGRYLVTGADQSSLYLEVEEVAGPDVIATAQHDAVLGGLLTVIHSSREAGGVSCEQLDLPILSPYDEEAIQALARDFEIDYVGLTHVGDGDDVHAARAQLDAWGLQGVKLIAKVESRAALLHFDAIVAAADAVCLSRGTLALDVAAEKVAAVQKAAVARCNAAGRPVLLTRLVDTMELAPRPTRAEATDVANAVLDGVDGLLLGAETLRGRYPVETVKTVVAICRQAEQVFDHEHHYDNLMQAAMQVEELEEGYGGVSPPGGSPLSRKGSAAITTVSDGVSPSGSPLGRSAAAADSPTSSGWMHVSDAAAREGPPPRGSRLSAAANDTDLAMTAGRKLPSFGSIPRPPSLGTLRGLPPHSPAMSKVESIASAAVRVAVKVQAGLIVVYAATGRTASLIAKYRPTTPIVVLVVPKVTSKGLSWQMEGKTLARQCLLVRGLIPFLGAPTLTGHSDSMLADAVQAAARRGLVGPGQHVVCVQSLRGDLVLKILSVDELGAGLALDHTGSMEKQGGTAAEKGLAPLAPNITADTRGVPAPPAMINAQ